MSKAEVRARMIDIVLAESKWVQDCFASEAHGFASFVVDTLESMGIGDAALNNVVANVNVKAYGTSKDEIKSFMEMVMALAPRVLDEFPEQGAGQPQAVSSLAQTAAGRDENVQIDAKALQEGTSRQRRPDRKAPARARTRANAAAPHTNGECWKRRTTTSHGCCK